MTFKIIVYAPARKKNAIEMSAAGISVVTDANQLRAAVDQLKSDLVLMLDAPVELRRQILEAARRNGRPAVACLNDAPAAGATPVSSPDPLEQARRYMDDNFRRPLSLGTIAGQAGLSACYLCRRFKSRYQDTPIEYLRKIRLARATHLLLHTNLPLAEITKQSGFFSVSYFCREFHKAKGLAPITFRRQKRNAESSDPLSRRPSRRRPPGPCAKLPVPASGRGPGP